MIVHQDEFERIKKIEDFTYIVLFKECPKTPDQTLAKSRKKIKKAMPVPNVHKTQSKKKKSVASRKELSIL
jgi:hypothetical protein